MSRIILVGSTGYVGKNLLRQCADFGEWITVGRTGCSYYFDLRDSDYSVFDSIVSSGDTCVILASVSSPELCEKDKDNVEKVNVVGTIGLIKKLIGLKARVIFSSSDTVFGSLGRKAFENDYCRPKGAYGDMKCKVENTFANEPLVKVIRFSYVVGPGDKFTNMLREFWLDKKSVEVFSGFERNIVSLTDVIAGIKKIIKEWDDVQFKTFNFSGPELVSRERLVGIFSAEVFSGLEFSVSEAPEGFWNCRSKCIETDNSNFVNLLGRTPYSINEIVADWRVENA